jgi:site-specific DNA recombinase
LADLRKRNIVTKARTLKTGEAVGSIPFTRGPLAHLLRNRFYIGEVTFKGEILKGEQPAIVERELFDAVQAKLKEQQNNHTAKRIQSDALLIGRVFDDRGDRMTPSHARKRGVKYRYYISSALLNGMAESAGSVDRVPAAEIEKLVTKSVREHLNLEQLVDDSSLINTHVSRVEIKLDQIVVHLAASKEINVSRQRIQEGEALHIPWRKMPSKRRREILVPEGVQPQHARPIRSENRATLVASIARGRRWLDEVTTGAKATSESIAKREGCSARKVNMTISLAFLAPHLVRAAIEGRLPHGMGVTRLADLPAEWSQQHLVLGLPAQ